MGCKPAEKQAPALIKAYGRREALKFMGASLAAGALALARTGIWRAAGGTRISSPDHPQERYWPKQMETLGQLASPDLQGRDGRPNIILIIGDNHNAKTMGCAGHPFIQTPGMDRLAREGLLFENTFSPTPLCSPSRASILTGHYARNHGVLNNHTPWTGGRTTFLEALSEQGYATAFIGKWHMPGKGFPEMPFLDLFVSYTYREGQGAYFNCPLIVNGEDVPGRDAYITGIITDYALDFIEGTQRAAEGQRKPFCVCLAHRPGHPPYQAPAEIAGMYHDADVKSILPDHIDPWWYGKANRNLFEGVMMGSYYDQYRKYCETLTAMDCDIVRLLDYLDRSGLSQDTVVIYLGDNGMQWGAHDRHGIREPYEDSIRLPLIVRAPMLVSDPGERREQMALNVDLAATLLQVAGAPIPSDLDGRSLVPILVDGGASGREAFPLEFWRYFPENTPSYRGVRTGRFKYIQFERGRRPWLFDLADDPGEQTNLYDTPEGRRILPGLLAMQDSLGLRF
jgi:N-acetylglucosamine-6-sulfatase